MKSLILKDFYNIGHNAKSMLFMLLFLAFIFIPFSTPEGYIILCGILCSMMVITTFSFDENSKWNKYAMVMPVSKKDMVASKFIVLLVFSTIGVAVGLVLAIIGGMITKKVVFNTESLTTLFIVALVALVIAEIFGSVSIPLLFKFGAEKARMLSIVSALIPAAICYIIYRVLLALGVDMTQNLELVLLCASPVIAIVWNLIMYKTSYIIFSKKELLL